MNFALQETSDYFIKLKSIIKCGTKNVRNLLSNFNRLIP